ncbi:hypothetical protein DXB41_12760 [Segatella copri]|uniref:Uncharacterized protein n=1 Tax=Segatella copri TaxID=165179 RepID=A0A3E5DVF3_9BACT|nr:hypothetical protein DXB41_12760 [Segatella copri]RGS16460.1 hypothetical protein DWY11_06425 [Segatella copri]
MPGTTIKQLTGYFFSNSSIGRANTFNFFFFIINSFLVYLYLILIFIFLQKYTEAFKIPNIFRQIYKKAGISFDFQRIIRIFASL